MGMTEQIEDRHIEAVSNAFRRMNIYAGGSEINFFGKDQDATEVLADVYFILASQWTPILKEYNAAMEDRDQRAGE